MASVGVNGIVIISGPTSSGKSHMLEKRPPLFVRTQGSADVWLASEETTKLNWCLENNPVTYVHYNLLRPADIFLRTSRRRRVLRLLRRASSLLPRGKTRVGRSIDRLERRQLTRASLRFQADAKWSAIRQSGVVREAIVLVTPVTELLERVQFRATEEPGSSRTYDREHWRLVLEEVDLEAVYRTWLRELKGVGITPRLVESSRGEITEITLDQLPAVLRREVTGVDTDWTVEQIREILKQQDFGYHSVGLPYGLRTRGASRSATADLVLPYKLKGWSVLDVGCAYGALCFEAERRGATSIVGTELKPERLKGARILGEVLNSKVEWSSIDVFESATRSQYDLVLFLNVLHHTADPVGALRNLVSMTRKRLVLEFPSFEDPRIPLEATQRQRRLLNRLPVVGVSSPSVDQTFVFSPTAVRRMLVDHVPFDGTIRILPSPIHGRAVLIADRR